MCGQSEASHNAARAVAALLRFSTFQPSLFERCTYLDSIPRGGNGGVLNHMVDAEAARWQCLGITVTHGKLSAGPIFDQPVIRSRIYGDRRPSGLLTSFHVGRRPHSSQSYNGDMPRNTSGKVVKKGPPCQRHGESNGTNSAQVIAKYTAVNERRSALQQVHDQLLHTKFNMSKSTTGDLARARKTNHFELGPGYHMHVQYRKHFRRIIDGQHSVTVPRVTFIIRGPVIGLSCAQLQIGNSAGMTGISVMLDKFLKKFLWSGPRLLCSEHTWMLPDVCASESIQQKTVRHHHDGDHVDVGNLDLFSLFMRLKYCLMPDLICSSILG
ncbi:hypothetical protein F5J12DRAFT_782287 [Pisolithus orientalis]|uniref:uncharacterized protein n=1 Tax=Pisolithus orientalis TaxID=936130 RepID=UPI0022243FA2|nr:uncharacterized protein F5J12DRAFT_782287 [Pisolithus orientalis]KAI6008865.1 hypothetical protein F5J12DRAFT_782287 [Pisolithus orientalis]